jgi:hypothetical protein
MNKKLIATALTLVSLQSTSAFSGEVLDGDTVAKMFVGNTLQMDFRPNNENFRKVFHEYYEPDGHIKGMERRKEQRGTYTHYVGTWEVKDGKFCTSVYGRYYACNTYEKINDKTYKITGENGTIRNVKLYQGKHHTTK